MPVYLMFVLELSPDQLFSSEDGNVGGIDQKDPIARGRNYGDEARGLTARNTGD